MRHLRTSLLAVLALALVASIAAATTVSELQLRANALESNYQALLDRMQADTESHAVLLSELNALEAQRAQLHSDRAGLGGNCGYPTTDFSGSASCNVLGQSLQRIDDLAAEAQLTMGHWGEDC